MSIPDVKKQSGLSTLSQIVDYIAKNLIFVKSTLKFNAAANATDFFDKVITIERHVRGFITRRRMAPYLVANKYANYLACKKVTMNGKLYMVHATRALDGVHIEARSKTTRQSYVLNLPTEIVKQVRGLHASTLVPLVPKT